MEMRIITHKSMERYKAHLYGEERQKGTVEKYLRDVRKFAAFLDGREAVRELAVQWRKQLLEQNYAPVTINSMLAAVNGFFRFMGWQDCRVKFLRIQRKLFREQTRELTRQEFDRLISTARDLGRERLSLLMETMAASGVRVSEVRSITVEAVRQGRVQISLKGKIRTILLPEKLCRKLEKYAKKQKITAGAIFVTRSGKSMTRGQIWSEMKAVCKKAGVDERKVFPHNLRHLFAVCVYRACHDVAKLADLLGHSSLETTRIYLATSWTDHRRWLDRVTVLT